MPIDLIDRGIKSDKITKLAARSSPPNNGAIYLYLVNEEGLAAQIARGSKTGAFNFSPDPAWFSDQQRKLTLISLDTISTSQSVLGLTNLTGQKKGMLQAAVTAIAGASPAVSIILQTHTQGLIRTIGGLGTIAKTGLYQLPVQFAADALSINLNLSSDTTSITLEVAILLRGIG